jgi:hypothetical protein
MSLPDATASAALAAKVIEPVTLIWMDVVGDVVRVNTSGSDIAVSGTGDPELDGFTFEGINASFIKISEVFSDIGGTRSVTAELSGVKGMDDTTLAVIQDPANWQGRIVRMWRMINDGSGVRQGGYQAYYTGYMMVLDDIDKPDGSTLRMTIESYIAANLRPSNRTILEQEIFDPDDKSALAAVAIANGTSGASLVATPAFAGFGGLGVFGGFGLRQF